MTRSIEPVLDMIFVEPIDADIHARFVLGIPEGTLIVPDAVAWAPNQGTVVAVGPLVEGIEVGDRIIWERFEEARLNEPWNGADRDCVAIYEHHHLLTIEP